MRIEFLYFVDCPHYQDALRLLQVTLQERFIKAPIRMIEIKDDEDAARNKFIGSPTIRINGADIEKFDGKRPYAKTCRVYVVNGKMSGTPSKEMIERLVDRATRSATDHNPS